MATSEQAGLLGQLEIRLGARGVLMISIALAVLFTAFLLWRHADSAQEAYSHPMTSRGDLGFLLASGRLVTSDERHLFYERIPDSQQAWYAEHGYIFPIYFPYPPVFAYGVAGFSLFDFETSADLWRALVALSSLILAVCVASVFSSWPWRIAVVVAILVWEPTLMNARIGQTGAFVAAALAVATVVYLRKREVGAVLFGLIAIKPTAVIGPALIVLQERPTIWLRFGAVAAAVILVPFLVLGPDAFLNWVDILLSRGRTDVGGGHSYNQGVSSLIGSRTSLGIAIALGGLVVAALLVRAVQAKMGFHIAMAFAILAGALVNPHSLFYDWGIAFVGLMLLRKSGIVPESTADLAFGALAISLFVAGQYTWDTKHEAGHYLRPLTAWTILVCGTILLSTLRRYVEPDETRPPSGNRVGAT